MSRTKRGVVTKAKHKKVLKKVKGQFGRRKNTIRVARQAMEKAMQYAYRDRKTKKRNFRSLWIARINAASKNLDVSYSVLINAMSKKDIKINRKILSDIAIEDPSTFKKVVEVSMN